MTGSPNQIELAEQIKPLADAEFLRVVHAFEARAALQSEPACSDTQAIIAILEEKRAEVMANQSAGYFITTWRELSDQVRQMIAADPRYQAIQQSRIAG